MTRLRLCAPCGQPVAPPAWSHPSCPAPAPSYPKRRPHAPASRPARILGAMDAAPDRIWRLGEIHALVGGSRRSLVNVLGAMARRRELVHGAINQYRLPGWASLPGGADVDKRTKVARVETIAERYAREEAEADARIAEIHASTEVDDPTWKPSGRFDPRKTPLAREIADDQAVAWWLKAPAGTPPPRYVRELQAEIEAAAERAERRAG